MVKSTKLTTTTAFVCAVILVALIFTGSPSTTFIRAGWNNAGFDRHGFRLSIESLLNDPDRENAGLLKIEFDSRLEMCTISIPGFPISQQESYKPRIVVFEVGSDIATVDGKQVKLASKTATIDGVIFVPISSLVDQYSAKLIVKGPKTEPQSRNPVYRLAFPPLCEVA